jgi:hypothetical protein
MDDNQMQASMETPETADMEISDPVEQQREESAEDDALQAPERTLDDFADNEEDNVGNTAANEGGKAPGWINKRIQSGVAKQMKPLLASMQADFNVRLKEGIQAATQSLRAEINVMRTSNIEREAQALVDAGTIKDLAIAKSYVQGKYGASTDNPNPEVSSPKPEQRDPRIDILAKQAIKWRQRGVDVFGAYERDAAIKQKVDSGEWDMYDVAEYMQKRGTTPVPTRSSNSASVTKLTPDVMTEEQFAKLNASLESGGEYKFRKRV